VLSSPGIGSGLDVRGIVDQLVAVESQPLVRLGARRVELEAQLSGFGRLQSAFSSFQQAMQGLAGIDKFQRFSTSVSDESVLSASADSSAARGTFAIEVQRTAEAHRLAAANTFADSDVTKVGSAGESLTITIGGASTTIEFGDLTLAQIRDAINDDPDNPGVTASLLRDDTGYRLTLAANATGSGEHVTLAYAGTDPFAFQTLNADRDGDATFTAADLDALLVLENQFPITSTSNTVSGAIQGVTLNLLAPGTASLEIDRDKAAVEDSVRAFVDGYNDLVGTLAELRGNVLRSERLSLLSIESQLRAVLNEAAATDEGFSLLFEVGVSTTRQGTLELDSAALQRALDTDFDGVAQLFGDPEAGYAVRLDRLADRFLDAGGVLDARTTSLERQVRDIEDRRAALQRRVASVEERLLAQFTALDGLLSQLNNTSDFLTRQLDQLDALNQQGRGR